MKKISICITYYNQKDFVCQSLDSVLGLDVPCDIEILCGDDGSTDGTVDIINRYIKKHPDNIKCFVMDRKETTKTINRASANRLNLAKNATGDYIMFLDGDDYYCDKSFLQDAIQILETDTSVAVCAFNYKYLYPDGSEKNNIQSMRPGINPAKDYIANGWYTHSGACVFRNVIDKKNLDLLLQINNFDDNAITIYMLQFGDIYYFDKPIYVYRQTNDSLWNSANIIEQDLINAFDYKLICDSAPDFRAAIAKRQYRALKNVYKNRAKLGKLLSNKYEKYVSVAEKNKDIFIYNLLKWNNLSLLQKIKTIILWRKFKKLTKGLI